MSSDQNILVKLKDAGFKINDKWLVKGVSLQVEKGKIVTLIGPNGSGKSTTAKIALGIYKKIDGSVEKNTDKIGYVPQKISIDWTLPLRVYDFMLLTENLDEETINNALSLTGVTHLKNKNLGDLSGGSFKARGAINNILSSDKKDLQNGITAVSAGNHAIAASYVSNIFKIKNKIFLYESANPYRVNNFPRMKRYCYLHGRIFSS